MAEKVYLRFVSHRLEPGQIWFVRKKITVPGRKRLVKVRPDSERPDLVLILKADRPEDPMSIIRVIPISYHRIFAGPYDLAFTRENSPLTNNDFMVECWNSQPMLRTNLDVGVGKASSEVMADVSYLWSCFVEDEVPEPDKLQSKGYFGSVIEYEEDPRVKFQREQVDLTAYLRAPANALE